MDEHKGRTIKSPSNTFLVPYLKSVSQVSPVCVDGKTEVHKHQET